MEKCDRGSGVYQGIECNTSYFLLNLLLMNKTTFFVSW